MIYVEYLNNLLKEEVNTKNKIVIFGQNVHAGSYLSGLTKGFDAKNGNILLNTQNSENSLVGFGFGLMLNNISSIYFMKQLDFLLLSIDQLVNTFNIIRLKKPKSSFTIFPITVDSGYEGPQSSLNNLDDFCSIAGIEAFSITNKLDSKYIIKNKLISPGFRIITTGQKLLKKNVIDLNIVHKNKNFFQYSKGRDLSIICFNQSLDYGLKLLRLLNKKGKSSSIFSINAHHDFDNKFILNDLNETKNVVIIDDTKSKNKLSDKFHLIINDQLNIKKCIFVKRKDKDINFSPNDDALKIDYDYLLNSF